ncbi:23S rRNA (adenine(2030)-N(6))-methyltransferase RlmJ [Aliiglaciecola sp. CAU 1673]|uniref:23S rRNA (adenine(2030)-N(6))-methyltransferase RlmJ n=1 Tax=Aliiglaciecola sp. CAU 1673 TaxID=3032595 RepID=UPI0023DA9915|nr:23S rRNA (adenine(2030)-N(6))-methyltransferase RlmJ [Aliiglaciecola sp. CAU 1673]MDF2177544.1 23S rRNA (adenine(2030)-N(6))-methyltransferase RlmJ [Aliiglaciecola sp. CAU 1673]
MLSYRHGYHAGNHADVLKHLCQLILLEKLAQKDKPFVYIDTHAGAGLYDLQSEQAQKTAEYEQGIDRLMQLQSANPHICRYQALVGEYHQQHRYPGSPELAFRLCREHDSLQLMEWHNQEVLNLKANFKDRRNVHIHHRNGFEGLVALCPPKPARGMVLIDPSYELPQDYVEVVESVKAAQKRWAGGTFAIWYPMLAKARDKSQTMLDGLSQLPVEQVLNIQLWVGAQPDDFGMYGSGMVIINPPWQFDEQVESLLQVLPTSLSDSPDAGARCQWLRNTQG